MRVEHARVTITHDPIARFDIRACQRCPSGGWRIRGTSQACEHYTDQTVGKPIPCLHEHLLAVDSSLSAWIVFRKITQRNHPPKPCRAEAARYPRAKLSSVIAMLLSNLTSCWPTLDTSLATLPGSRFDGSTMVRDARLLFGPTAALVLALGLVALPPFVAGYSSVRQTVSEIGEMVSPMRWPFAALLLFVGLLLLIFASGVRRALQIAGRSTVSAFCVAWMGIAAAALGVFAFPHPLHGIIGLSELVAYQAPLAFALAWRSDARMRQPVAFSILMYVLLLASIAINLSTLARDSTLWSLIRPVFGMVQRSLFACFFLWIAGAGWMLWLRSGQERRLR
jgi:hypothetical membrane protein